MFGCQRSQKNNIVGRLHQITPQKTSTKLKKNRIWSLHTCSSTHVWGFLKLCASRLRHSRGTIYHVWTSKKQKKKKYRQPVPPNNTSKNKHEIIKNRISTLQFYYGIHTRCKQTDKSYIKNKKNNVAFSRLATWHPHLLRIPYHV